MSACPIVISPVFNANIDNFCFLTFFFLSQMFYWSSQRTSFLFHWLFSIAFVFNFINFCSCFYYFLPSSFGLLLILFVVCFLIWKLRLLTWGFSSLLMWAFSAINLTFSTVLLCPTFWHVFSCFPWNFLFDTLFRNMLFSFQVLRYFPVIFLLLISGLIPVSSESPWFQFI